MNIFINITIISLFFSLAFARTLCFQIEDDPTERSTEGGYESGGTASSAATTPTPTDRSHTPLPYFRPPTSKRKLNTIDQMTTDALQIVGKKLTSMKEDDTYDIFGKYIADRLRKINPEQYTFAQKLIGDVIFEAEMDSLNRYCKITGNNDLGNQNYQQGQRYRPQTSNFYNDQRGLGQEPFFQPQTTNFNTDLRGQVQQSFPPQTSNFYIEPLPRGQQPFQPAQTTNFNTDLRDKGQQPFPKKMSNLNTEQHGIGPVGHDSELAQSPNFHSEPETTPISPEFSQHHQY